MVSIDLYSKENSCLLYVADMTFPCSFKDYFCFYYGEISEYAFT